MRIVHTWGSIRAWVRKWDVAMRAGTHVYGTHAHGTRKWDVDMRAETTMVIHVSVHVYVVHLRTSWKPQVEETSHFQGRLVYSTQVLLSKSTTYCMLAPSILINIKSRCTVLKVHR